MIKWLYRLSVLGNKLVGRIGRRSEVHRVYRYPPKGWLWNTREIWYECTNPPKTKHGYALGGSIPPWYCCLWWKYTWGLHMKLSRMTTKGIVDEGLCEQEAA